ncbi:MAG: TonB family protein [Acidobacteriota bacterium]
MGMSGNLQTVPLVDLLQWITADSRTGALILQHEGEKRVYFRRGRVVSFYSSDERDRFGQFLVHTGSITPIVLAKVLEAEQREKKALGAALVDRGELTEDEVKHKLRLHALELCTAIFLWKEGHFEFVNEDIPEGKFVAFAISVDEILLEAHRRIDEWTRIRNVFPVQGMVPKLDPEIALKALTELDPNSIEYMLIEHIDGRRTIHDLYMGVPASEFVLYEALYRLFSQGIITVADKPAVKDITDEFILPEREEEPEVEAEPAIAPVLEVAPAPTPSAAVRTRAEAPAAAIEPEVARRPEPRPPPAPPPTGDVLERGFPPPNPTRITAAQLEEEVVEPEVPAPVVARPAQSPPPRKREPEPEKPRRKEEKRREEKRKQEPPRETSRPAPPPVEKRPEKKPEPRPAPKVEPPRPAPAPVAKAIPASGAEPKSKMGLVVGAVVVVVVVGVAAVFLMRGGGTGTSPTPTPESTTPTPEATTPVPPTTEPPTPRPTPSIATPSPAEKAQELAKQAEAALKAKKAADAEASANEALKLDPGNTLASQILAKIETDRASSKVDQLIAQARGEERAGNLDAAERLYKEAQAADPASTKVEPLLKALAVRREKDKTLVPLLDSVDRYVKAKDADNAVKEIAKAEAVDKNDPRVVKARQAVTQLSDAANAAKAQGFLDEAKKAIDAGNADAAEKAIDSARALDKSNPQIASLADRVKALRSTPPPAASKVTVGSADPTGSGFAPIKFVSKPLPEMPKGASAKGVVMLSVLVAVDGSVKDVKLLKQASPESGYNEAAKNAARQWKFSPPVKEGGGAPEESWWSVVVKFEP